jgi:uncharacterized Zn finger protein (UPF0148 family)
MVRKSEAKKPKVACPLCGSTNGQVPEEALRRAAEKKQAKEEAAKGREDKKVG